jgi:hypothetical protein
METLRLSWKSSRWFRILLVAALIYTAFRVIVQGAFLAVLLFPNQDLFGGIPGWVGSEGPMIPADLQIYLDAAEHLKHQEDLYLQGSLEHLESHYPYAPSFALAFVPFTWFSPGVTAVLQTVLHFVAYGYMFVSWQRIFQDLSLKSAGQMLAYSLPVWLVFSSFWTDLGYLNIYLIIALISTLLIESVLKENLWGAVLWLSIILQIKPHWAFAAAVPLLLGRYRFFGKLMALTFVSYVCIAGATILIVGPEYGFTQHVEYFNFLRRLSPDFPWRTMGEDPFLGYNHSLKQLIIYFLGDTTTVRRLAEGLKVLLLIPVGVVALRELLHPIRRPGYQAPIRGLDWAFALYLSAFIWLDMVWELSLSVAIFPYLLGTLEERSGKIWISGIYLPYALLDPWRVFSLVFSLLGMEVIAPGPYVVTDPAIYLPLIFIVLICFYFVLVKRLWGRSRYPSSSFSDVLTHVIA